MKLNWIVLILVLSLANTSEAQTKVENDIVLAREVPMQKIKVFPNPATTIVNVLGLKNSRKSAISILDTYGNVVLELHWEIKNNALNIPITTLEPGIYMITIHSEEEDVQTNFYKQ